VSEFSEALAEAAASVSGAPDYAVSASRRLVSLLWPTGEYKVLMADGSRVIGEGVASSLAWGNGFVKWNGGGGPKVQKTIVHDRPNCAVAAAGHGFNRLNVWMPLLPFSFKF
jgi:hypothetical protein